MVFTNIENFINILKLSRKFGDLKFINDGSSRAHDSLGEASSYEQLGPVSTCSRAKFI